MISVSNLPATLAVFPLPGALLLPRSRLPLHIFEPRYLAMLDEVLRSDHRMIGMVQPRAVPGEETQKLQAIGCAGRVTAFSETEDGRYMITLTGISRFRILEEIECFAPFRKCEVSWAGFDRDMGGAEQDDTLDRSSFLKLLGRYFEENGLEPEWDSLREADDELLINSLSMLCPFSATDKQALLEAPTLATRRETLAALIEFDLCGGDGRETMQ